MDEQNQPIENNSIKNEMKEDENSLIENKKKEDELPACCQPVKDEKGNIKQGIIYGLIPHTGCIAFIIAAILGSTIMMQYFKPVLMSRYIFHYLIGISIGFAALSSGFYLKKHKLLSWDGMKKKRRYLSIMFGTVVGVNLILFLGVFPALANVGAGSISDDTINNRDFSMMKISVDIPCPGHAPLISSELSTINGVEGSEFSFPNDFEVYYDPEKTSEQEILALEVFGTYPAEVLSAPNEQVSGVLNKVQALSADNGGSEGGSCGGGGGCGCGG